MKKATFLFLASFFVSALLIGQSADDIISKYLENNGGVENMKSMKSMKMTGILPTPQGDFPFTLLKKSPDKMKTIIDFQGTTFIPQAYDGEIAWTLNPFTGSNEPEELPEEMLEMLKEQAIFEDPVIDYKEKGHEITLEGKEDVDGVEAYKLKMVRNKNNDKAESTEYYFFDTEFYFPIMIRSTVNTGTNESQEIEQYLGDYREIEGGYLIPFHMESRMNGQVAQEINFESVEINVDIPDEEFAFPGNNNEETEEKKEEEAKAE